MLLIDNNLYEKLRKSEKGNEISNFRNALNIHGLNSEINPKLLLTPMTVIEALGIKFDKNKYRASATQKQRIDFKSEFQSAYEHYSNCVNKIDFEECVKRQQLHSKAMGKGIENLAVSKQVERPFFREELTLNLAFDSLLNQKYTDAQVEEIMYAYAIPFLFLQGAEKYRNISQLRLAKKVFDEFRSELPKVKDYDFLKSLNIESGQDYVDCDIVHRVTIGSYYDDCYHRVVAATLDDANVIRARIAVYKSYIKLLTEKFVEKENIKTVSSIVQLWMPGTVIVFGNNLNVVCKIDAKDM